MVLSLAALYPPFIPKLPCRWRSSMISRSPCSMLKMPWRGSGRLIHHAHGVELVIGELSKQWLLKSDLGSGSIKFGCHLKRWTALGSWVAKRRWCLAWIKLIPPPMQFRNSWVFDCRFLFRGSNHHPSFKILEAHSIWKTWWNFTTSKQLLNWQCPKTGSLRCSFQGVLSKIHDPVIKANGPEPSTKWSQRDVKGLRDHLDFALEPKQRHHHFFGW